MCIFCKSTDLAENFFIENIHRRYNKIECKNCNSEIRNYNGNCMVVIKYPNKGNNYLKYRRILFWILPIMFIFAILGITTQNIIDNNTFLKMFSTGLTVPLLLFTLWASENILNFKNSGYMIVFRSRIIIKSKEINENIYHIIPQCIMSIIGSILFFWSIYAILNKL